MTRPQTPLATCSLHRRSGRVQWGLLVAVLLLAGIPVLAFLMYGSRLSTILGAAHSDLSWEEYLAAQTSGDDTLHGPTATFLAEALVEFNRHGAALSIGYRPPGQLVYSTRAISPCHGMRTVSGPFYCGDDERLYLEQGFFDDLEDPFGPKSQLSQAYFVGFLMAQHLQTRLGMLDRLRDVESNGSTADYRALQRSLLLQASYWTGVWASKSPALRELVQQVPTVEALRHIDTLQKKRTDRYSIEGGELGEMFEGTSLEQRAAWFDLGYKSGNYSSHPELPELQP